MDTSLTRNENLVDCDRPLTNPIDDQDSRDYRYETFRAHMLLNDARFSSDSLRPGQALTDRTLIGSGGDEISLRNHANGRPMVLITGSMTCPLTISTLPVFEALNRLYGDRVALAFIYTREAHPGELLDQPATIEEKVERARRLKEIHGVDWPVLVDDLGGTLHQALDTKQNSVHILDPDGTVLFRALFAGDRAVEKAIAEVVREGRPRRSQAFGRLGGPMKSIGYIEETLQRAGSKAYRDVLRAVPPMAIMAMLARVFPFLPKASRGWAAAGVLMIGSAAVAVGAFGVFW